MKLIAPPTYIPKEQYCQLTEKIKNFVFKTEGTISMYQMGSVKDPGISDLDLICIFKNDSSNNLNIREKLSSQEKQILTHGLFGVHEQYLNRSLSFGLISNLKLIGGKDIISKTPENVNLKANNIKTQIAFEYLIKMYITLDVHLTLGIIKLRSFLLLSKAISFDLELLGVQDGELYQLVRKIIAWREMWFTQTPLKSEIKETIKSFYFALKQFLQEFLRKENFYLPQSKIVLPGGFNIVQDNTFGSRHKGFPFPSNLAFLGKKYINLQHRFNKYQYHIPFQISKENSIIHERFQFYSEITKANNKELPLFMPLTTSLNFS